jgi:hypothetical protein
MESIPLPIMDRRAACRNCPYIPRFGRGVSLGTTCLPGGAKVRTMIERRDGCPKGRFPALTIPDGHLVITYDRISGWKDGPRHGCC